VLAVFSGCIIRFTASHYFLPSLSGGPILTAMSSSPLPPSPPEYAPAPEPWLLGPPLYSQDASSSEVLVEASQPPPDYPNINITRTNTSRTVSTTHSNLSRTGDTAEYRYRNGNLEISLGPKVPGFDIASYGKGGIIRGTVTLKKHTWVESVVINACSTYSVVPDICPDSPVLLARRHRADRYNTTWNAYRQIIHAHSQSQTSALHKGEAPTSTHRPTELSLRVCLPNIGPERC